MISLIYRRAFDSDQWTVEAAASALEFLPALGKLRDSRNALSGR